MFTSIFLLAPILYHTKIELRYYQVLVSFTQPVRLENEQAESRLLRSDKLSNHQPLMKTMRKVTMNIVMEVMNFDITENNDDYDSGEHEDAYGQLGISESSGPTNQKGHTIQFLKRMDLEITKEIAREA